MAACHKLAAKATTCLLPGALWLHPFLVWQLCVVLHQLGSHPVTLCTCSNSSLRWWLRQQLKPFKQAEQAVFSYLAAFASEHMGWIASFWLCFLEKEISNYSPSFFFQYWCISPQRESLRGCEALSVSICARAVGVWLLDVASNHSQLDWRETIALSTKIATWDLRVSVQNDHYLVK